jgi:hypothetical protein
MANSFQPRCCPSRARAALLLGLLACGSPSPGPATPGSASAQAVGEVARLAEHAAHAAEAARRIEARCDPETREAALDARDLEAVEADLREIEAKILELEVGFERVREMARGGGR